MVVSRDLCHLWRFFFGRFVPFVATDTSIKHSNPEFISQDYFAATLKYSLDFLFHEKRRAKDRFPLQITLLIY